MFLHQSSIFDPFYGKNVTYCIDTSASMYNSLDTVKENLKQYLKDQAYFINDFARKFNLIDFSTETRPWSDRMVLLNASTVRQATQWIDELQIRTGKNTLDSIQAAFNDIDCHSIVLITNNIPDQEESYVIDEAIKASKKRQIHCIYIRSENKDKMSDDKTTRFLSSLALATGGSLKIIHLIKGTSQSVILAPEPRLQTLHPAITNQPLIDHVPIQMYDYPKLINPSQEEFVPYLDPLLPVSKIISQTPNLDAILVGQTVLARNSIDGFYYKGKCIKQIAPHRFKIEFNTNNSPIWKDFLYQDTPVYDIINYDDAKEHPIKIGDKVLAIIDSISEKYAPCEVLDGYEGRSYQNSTKSSSLIVNFKNGKTISVPENQAIWLSNEMYDRIKFELNMPSKARKYLEENILDYPYKSLPGYPITPINFNMYSPLEATLPIYTPYFSSYLDPNLNRLNKKPSINEPSVKADLIEKQARDEKFENLQEKIRTQLLEDSQLSSKSKSWIDDQEDCCSCCSYDQSYETKKSESRSIKKPNRFGNPSVTIGLSDDFKGKRKFPERSTSANQSVQSTRTNTHLRLYDDVINGKEQLRQQFRRDRMSKIQEFEALRSELAAKKEDLKEMAKRYNAEKQSTFFKDQ